jgi:dethiobiotin synthase
MRRYRHAAQNAGRRLRYWKPIQTGIEQDDDSRTVRDLAGGDGGEILAEGIRLERPVSPHLAARLARRVISVPQLVAQVSAEPPGDRWIVEGAGGLLVPLDEATMMADLMKALSLPVLVVARSTLGTINHTLLTLEALAARGLPVAGIVMVGPLNPANREAIESFGGLPVVGQLPVLDPLTPETLGACAADHLDPDTRLEGHLR